MKIRISLAALLTAGLFWAMLQPAVAAPSKSISKDKAIQIVWRLPEVKAWAQAIEKQSKGKAHGASKVDDEDPETIGKKQYWSVTCFVDLSDHIHRWHTFMIRVDGKEILADSIASGDFTKLEKWRRSEKPMQGIDEPTLMMPNN